MNQTRREFLKHSAAAAMAASVLPCVASRAQSAKAVPAKQPWYRRTLRWGQTNITEADAANYDIAWWRGYWKRTRVQGVIINAGGIVAYYPSREPLQYRPPGLGERDLFGELVRAAHSDGLAVFARMDSNRTHEPFYRAHPDWFALDAGGKPYKSGDLFVTCVNSPYYDEFIPAVLREIAERYRPEGFTDNSWSGLGRESICYCPHCERKFRVRSGQPLPRRRDWDDPIYRDWILWNYARRLEIWDLNNRAAKAAGGPECLWVGMNSGSISSQAQSFRDCKEICARAELIMLDHQARSDAAGFQQNGESGKLVHELLGWEKLIPESMAMYQAGRPTFRRSSKPEPEARLWMLDGVAGGILPWWHHVGAYQEDLRQFHTAEAVNRWHEANAEFLVNREPVATVGLVWSQRNTDFYGRERATELVELPWRGWTNALVRARIPYLPVHADHLDRAAARFSTLILPNLAAISDSQAASLRNFVEHGGSLIATGRTGLYNEWGQPREDFVLADLMGAHLQAGAHPSNDSDRSRALESIHSYLRLTPELRDAGYGPKLGNEPPANGRRHEALHGFDDTDILPFGGWLSDVVPDSYAEVLLTFIPPFPTYPPEKSWMREPRTNIPGLVVRHQGSGGKTAFLPADLDRRYASDNLPDHGNLLANLVRWAAGPNLPLHVEGPGLIDCHLYRQSHRLILHLVNLTNTATWRAPVEELLPVGPFRIRLALPAGVKGKTVRLLVAGKRTAISIRAGFASLRHPDPTARTNPEVELHRDRNQAQGGRRFSLSPGERVGVRGNLVSRSFHESGVLSLTLDSVLDHEVLVIE